MISDLHSIKLNPGCFQMYVQFVYDCLFLHSCIKCMHKKTQSRINVNCLVSTDDALRMQVDLNITRLPVYVPSRHTIHHFSCDQSFRRDEIHSHHENIHNRIICHLGVWMDVHCPLSLYGCPFTRRNLIPCAPRGSRIVFNRQLASFGVETMPLVGAFLGDDLFSCLPVEVVLLILSYLDAFSLMNMALTCHRLRDVCCQILTRHGVVEVVWKRDKYSKKWTDQAKVMTFYVACQSVCLPSALSILFSVHLFSVHLFSVHLFSVHQHSDRILL